MGLEPDRVPHIHEASRFLGNSSPILIDQAGEAVRRPQVPFQVVPEFRHLADSPTRVLPNSQKLISSEGLQYLHKLRPADPEST
jgi:hypothetical protein